MMANHYFSVLLITLFTSLTLLLSGQEMPLKIGQWQAHYSYYEGLFVTQSPTHVFYGNEQGLLKIDKVANERERLSTVDGLSESGMSLIQYDRFNQLLISTYFNGNIDFVYEDGSIFNLPFVVTSDIIGDKSINHILVTSDTTAYLSMGFGLKILNVRDQEFGDETRAGLPFNQVSVYNNELFAATDEGIYKVSLAREVNIQDFGNWEYLGAASGFPDDYQTNGIITYADHLYFDVNDTIYRYDDNNLEFVFQEDRFSVQYMTNEGPHLMVGLACDNQNCNGKALFFDPNGLDKTINEYTGCINRPTFGVEDEQGRIYFADLWRGFRIPDEEDSCEPFTVNSPFHRFTGQLTLFEDELWVATEVIGSNGQFNDRGFYYYADGEWTNYFAPDIPGLTGNKGIYRTAVHPDNTKVYFGTRWNTGLLVLDRATNEVIPFDNAVAKIKPSVDVLRNQVTGLAFDSQGNLWIANNTNDAKGLIVLKPDGTFTDSFLTIPNRDTWDMIVDSEDYIWIGSNEQGLMVYDYNGTIDDPSDDEVRHIRSNNSALPNDQIRSLAVDLNGSVWIGTREGAVVFECQGDPLNVNCQGTHPRVSVDSIGALLLKTEKVNTIAVDAANRKWFGTPNGVFIQSPNGTERIATFNSDNSPLFNNAVSSIAINKETGLVYMASGNGLISLKTDAAGDKNFHTPNDILAYPNPVRPDYDGPIAIKGFARDSDIKITDINGQLIYETQTLGGQAIWDGRDYNGRKASSGVYLVYATRTSNRDMPEAIVTKILFMN